MTVKELREWLSQYEDTDEVHIDTDNEYIITRPLDKYDLSIVEKQNDSKSDDYDEFESNDLITL